MLDILGGPFRDQETIGAFRVLQNTPHLIVNTEEQKKRYALKLIRILDEHPDYRVYQLTPTVVKFGRFTKGGIDVLKVLYPPDASKSVPKSDWTNNPPKKRIPYFSLFHIGESHG